MMMVKRIAIIVTCVFANSFILFPQCDVDDGYNNCKLYVETSNEVNAIRKQAVLFAADFDFVWTLYGYAPV